MKKLLFVVLTVCTLLGVSGCGSKDVLKEDEKAPKKQIINDTYGFEVTVPETWVIDETVVKEANQERFLTLQRRDEKAYIYVSMLEVPQDSYSKEYLASTILEKLSQNPYSDNFAKELNELVKGWGQENTFNFDQVREDIPVQIGGRAFYKTTSKSAGEIDKSALNRVTDQYMGASGINIFFIRVETTDENQVPAVDAIMDTICFTEKEVEMKESQGVGFRITTPATWRVETTDKLMEIASADQRTGIILKTEKSKYQIKKSRIKEELLLMEKDITQIAKNIIQDLGLEDYQIEKSDIEEITLGGIEFQKMRFTVTGEMEGKPYEMIIENMIGSGTKEYTIINTISKEGAQLMLDEVLSTLKKL